MPSKKATEQAMTWLNSMAADKNSLDGVNAELCINVILDLRKKLEKLGAQFNAMKQTCYQMKRPKENFWDPMSEADLFEPMHHFED